MVAIQETLQILVTIIGVAISAWLAIIMFILFAIYMTVNHDGDK
jgi:hypothetical protein